MATIQTSARQDPHTHTSERFMPFCFMLEHPSLWLGFAALLGWIDLIFCFEGALRDQVTEAGGLVHDPLFLAATLTLAVVLGLGALLPKGLPSTRVISPLACLAGCLCSAAATALTSLLPQTLAWVPVALGVALGACAAWALLAWGEALAQLDLRAALLVVSTASFLQWVVFIPVLYAGLAARIAIVGALPLVSAWALRRNKQAKRRASATRAIWDSKPAAPVPPRLAAAGGLFSFVAQFMWCYFIKALPGRLDVGLFPGVFAVVTAVSALAGIICNIHMERCRAYRLELYYRTAFAFCLCGIAATGVASAIVDQAELFSAYALVYVGYSLLGPTLWMLALGCAFTREGEPRRVLGAVLAAQYVGMFLGFLAVNELSAPLFDALPTSVVVLACVLVTALAYTALFPERNLLELAPALFGIGTAPVEQRCEELSAAHGLTPRETEVLTLLARGRDAAFVCEELGIARNTANVHRKSIYAKLGVHSQQELLDLVEGAGQE